MVLIFFYSNLSFAETILLNCKIIGEGKLYRYKNDKVAKVEKPNLTPQGKKFEIRLNLIKKELIKAPYADQATVYWGDDSIIWTGKSEYLRGYVAETYYTLDRLNGIVSSTYASYDKKYFDNGDPPKEILEWVQELKHKCEKREKVF